MMSALIISLTYIIQQNLQENDVNIILQTEKYSSSRTYIKRSVYVLQGIYLLYVQLDITDIINYIINCVSDI